MLKKFRRSWLLVLLGAFLLWPTNIKADLAIPTITSIYLTQGGQPYNQPVDYEINCFGYMQFPDGQKEFTTDPIYTMQGHCSRYGCQNDDGIYLNYRYIDYCDFEGETQGKSFIIEKYNDYPVDDCSGGTMDRMCKLTLELPSDLDVENKDLTYSWWDRFICWIKNLLGIACN